MRPTDHELRKSCMDARDVATELRRYEGQDAFDTGPFDEQIALVSHVPGPASEREVAECFADRVLPDVLRELWAATREATLFEDSVYGQSGLRLLGPPDAVAATRRLYETGPVTGSELADVVVFGKFIGDQEGLAVDRASGAVVLVPELPNVDEGVVVAQDLVEFLRTFREAGGRKYWE
ncbi:MAG: hypothetical protein ACXVYW_17375 [Oryzihumus sp.]